MVKPGTLQPLAVTLSPSVRALYGYKDGHVELEVKLPPPFSLIKKTYSKSFEAALLRPFKKSVDNCVMWADLPEEHRSRLSDPFVIVLSPEVKGRYGFPDGHVELEVDLPEPLAKLKKTYTDTFSAAEIRSLKKAVDQAVLWAELPDHQRQQDGV